MTHENFVARQYKEAEMENTPLEEIKETSVLQRTFNKAMAVDYINKTQRWDLDVRKSYCYYDEDKDFLFMLSERLQGTGVTKGMKLKNGKELHYWSKGIV